MINENTEIYTPALKKHVEELSQQKKYEEALAIINGILSKDSNNSRALSDKVTTLGMNRQNKEAIETADIALKNNPTDYLLWYNKGVSLYHMQCYPEALEAFNQCLRINQDFVQAISKKISILLFTSQYLEATVLFESADLPISEYYYYLNNIGYAFLELGEFEKSAKYLFEASHKEKHPIVLYNLAELFRRRKDYKRFILFFCKAKLRGIYNRYFDKKYKSEESESSKVNVFLGPGKMFLVKPQVRETRAIFKLFRTPHWAKHEPTRNFKINRYSGRSPQDKYRRLFCPR